MQILPRLKIGQVGFDEVRRTFDTYLQRIVEAINHNVKEVEVTRRVRLPVDGRIYDVNVSHLTYKYVSINAQLLSGTCDIVIGFGPLILEWKNAGGVTLSLSSILLTDTVELNGSWPANKPLQIFVSNSAGTPTNMLVTLRTGS